MSMKDSLYPLKRIQTIIRVAPTTKWSQSQHKLAISGKRGYRTLGKETLTFYNCWIWRKKKYLQNVSACKTDPDLKLKSYCEPITGLHTPTEEGVQGPPTCQVPLQRGRSAAFPTVAGEEEPEEEGGQHQNYDPEELGHGWVSDSPG